MRIVYDLIIIMMKKIASQDSKLDSIMSVLIILAVTGIIVFWVATQ